MTYFTYNFIDECREREKESRQFNDDPGGSK